LTIRVDGLELLADGLEVGQQEASTIRTLSPAWLTM